MGGQYTKNLYKVCYPAPIRYNNKLVGRAGIEPARKNLSQEFAYLVNLSAFLPCKNQRAMRTPVISRAIKTICASVKPL